MNERNQSGHEQFADDLALYALGALAGGEREALERHLETCPACRRDLEAHRGDAALLALSATSPHPPLRSRDRLLSAIAHEPRGRSLRALAVRRPWWALAPVLTTMLLAVFALLLWRESSGLRPRLEQARNEVAQKHAQVEELQRELARAQETVALLSSPEAVRVTLSPRGRPEPQGKALYLERTGRLVLIASNLAPVPPDKTYELWLIPVQGAPIPAGTFKPNERGEATIEHQLPAGTRAKAFGITIENEGGSNTPTPPILLSGSAGL
ncbi:MAG: anti-sigma factor [Acidobacteriales bacterium]|nr:anti-sigma factor [Terriglobales bacterium]